MGVGGAWRCGLCASSFWAWTVAWRISLRFLSESSLACILLTCSVWTRISSCGESASDLGVESSVSES